MLAMFFGEYVAESSASAAAESGTVTNNQETLPCAEAKSLDQLIRAISARIASDGRLVLVIDGADEMSDMDENVWRGLCQSGRKACRHVDLVFIVRTSAPSIDAVLDSCLCSRFEFASYTAAQSRSIIMLDELPKVFFVFSHHFLGTFSVAHQRIR